MGVCLPTYFEGREMEDTGAREARVYVGNLSWDTTEEQLIEHMRSVGEAVSATIITDSLGRSKGCGIVEYATKQAALDSIDKLHSSTIGDSSRQIFIREDRETKRPAVKRGAEKGRKVFVGNLPYSASWQDLKDHFKRAGHPVVRADIAFINAEHKKSRGHGTVLFETVEAAQAAISDLHDTEFNGRKLIVHEDNFV